MTPEPGRVQTEDTPRPRIPLSTYRIQLNREFTFTDAARIIPYLHALGIDHCYTSPYLKAVPGSLHGYDVVDPTTLNPELGTRAAYDAFTGALARHGMGHLLDVVPNHMGIGSSANVWWLDVLENGPSSPYAAFFDIDWHPIKVELSEKVLLPILGDQYGIALESQDIQLAYADGAFVTRYFDYALPIAVESYARILRYRLDEMLTGHGGDDVQVQELQSILTALEHLPARSKRDAGSVNERYREKEIIKKRLAALIRESPTIANFIEENVRLFNGVKGAPKSFDSLDALLNEQAYRLAYWRVAAEEINYRRFFDINELAAVRMENPEVFEKSHALIFELVRQGVVTGLRIDHADGLYDPGAYLHRLHARAASNGEPRRSIFVVVEKILGPDERIPDEWPVHGTTGYEFLSLLNGLFVDGANERPMSATYARFTGASVRFEDVAYQSRLLVMRTSMASEINVLGQYLNLLSERDRRFRDFTLNSLTRAVREIIANFPVYRTYVGVNPGEPIRDHDRASIRLAVAKAKRRNPAVSGSVFDFVRDLLLAAPDEAAGTDRQDRIGFLMKFQQTTSPVSAKGVEDTALYLFSRLLSLNEVGNDPERFGIEPRVFHDAMQERAVRRPHALSATSTHDTKRGEDVRARLNVLSEIPKEWRSRVSRWQRLNRRKKPFLDEQPAPDSNVEYFLYQTLVGTWPPGEMNPSAREEYIGRIQAYMTKALREAKVHSSWMNPNQPYEEAVKHFVRVILDPNTRNTFLQEFLGFAAMVARLGVYNSLAQLVLKITAPGIPDFYQGTELWDLSLVDPDNRRPVDYETRSRLLSELLRASDAPGRRALLDELLHTMLDGRIKLFVTAIALRYRRERARVFLAGAYHPLRAFGSRERHLFGLARAADGETVIAAVPRMVASIFPAGLISSGPNLWGDTGLEFPVARPGSAYRNLFTGETVHPVAVDGRPACAASDLFATFPVALLERLP